MVDTEPKPKDPELLRCQVEFKKLSDEILEQKPPRIRLTLFNLNISTNPEGVLERLKQSSLRDMMLEDGESLSIPGSTYYPDTGLVIGETPLSAVSITHWDWKYEKTRIDPKGPNRPPYKIINFPGEYDWRREIDILLHYTNGINRGSQRLILQEGSAHAGRIPNIIRSIYVNEYAETGYEGHNHKHRSFINEDEAMFFINLARELFEKRELI